jgi:hypothetical protein
MPTVSSRLAGLLCASRLADALQRDKQDLDASTVLSKQISGGAIPGSIYRSPSTSVWSTGAVPPATTEFSFHLFPDSLLLRILSFSNVCPLFWF